MSLTNRARLLYGSPLSRPRTAVPIVIGLVVIIAFSVSSYIGELSPLPPAGLQIYFIALAASLLVSLAPLAILWFLDRREPESRWLYLIAVFWGAIIALELATPLNTYILDAVASFVKVHPEVQAIFGDGVDLRMMIGAPLAGPLVEEAVKGLGVLLLFWLLRAEFDNVRDGFIYGALVGIGFNVTEAAYYVLQGYIQTGDAPLYYQLADRFSLFGLAGHALFTGMFGMGLGLARQTTRRWLRYAAPVVGWLLGFSMHFLNNGQGLLTSLGYFIANGKPQPQESTPEAVSEVVVPFLNLWITQSAVRLVSFFPFFLIVGVVLWQSGIWERQVIREELADETEPVITPEEYEQVKRDRIFRTRRIPHPKRRTAAAIVRAQNELALRKWRVKHTGRDVETDPLVACWRDELVRLRG